MRAVPLGLGIFEYAVCRNAYWICFKTSLSMLSLGRRALLPLATQGSSWSALSTLLEAQMITGKTAVSLVAQVEQPTALSHRFIMGLMRPRHMRGCPATSSATGQRRLPQRAERRVPPLRLYPE